MVYSEYHLLTPQSLALPRVLNCDKFQGHSQGRVQVSRI